MSSSIHARFNQLSLTAALSLLTTSFLSATEKVETIQSPDGKISVCMTLEHGQPAYRVDLQDKALIKTSRLNLSHPEAKQAPDWKLVNQQTRSANTSWSPVHGKRTRIRDHFNQSSWDLRSSDWPGLRWKIIVRVYNDGLAYRYQLSSDTSAKATLNAGSQINFVQDHAWWSYREEKAPLGPEMASKINNRRQYPIYTETQDGWHLAVSEARLRDSAWSVFTSKKGHPGFSTQQPLSLKPATSKPDGPWLCNSSWKVIMIGDRAGQLIDSDLIANLNPKADPADYSWLKPGVCFWDWRAWGYQTDQGKRYELDLPTWKRFIDFASENDIPYLLIDANWYGPEFSKNSNPLSGGKAADVRKALLYGQQKQVGLVLYLNHVAATNYGIEEIIKAYAEWGAAGIKYGFMHIKDPKEKVQWTHRIVRLCAQYKLMVNFHDRPIPPTGEEATWPNLVHREFCHAQSDAKRAFSPSDFIKMAHVNMLAGPLDMNNGLFDLNHSLEQRPKIFSQVDSTITAEAARTLITYGGGLTVIPDAADAYRKHPEAFRFISAQKQPWKQSQTLSASIGEHISMMRQAADGNYLVASVTNEKARTLRIPLDFLPPGKTFNALIIKDHPSTHYQNKREAYQFSKRRLTSKDHIDAWLAPGGGHCILLVES